MMKRLFGRGPEQNTIRALYGAIVAQARHPGFYRAYGVPDTVEGRLDMIVLHLFLVLRRLRRDAATHAYGQAAFDLFCQDMDDNLREMGVGDLAVPRQMRRIGEAFYGRAESYDQALALGMAELAATLGRNIFGVANAPVPAGADRLAAYVREAERRLAGLDSARVTAATLHFPDPDTILGTEDFPKME